MDSNAARSEFVVGRTGRANHRVGVNASDASMDSRSRTKLTLVARPVSATFLPRGNDFTRLLASSASPLGRTPSILATDRLCRSLQTELDTSP